jgi:DNA repair protein RadC
MTDDSRVHRFVTIQQIVRATQPETADLSTLFDKWGLTNSTQEALWVVSIDNMDQLKTVTEVARGGFHDVIVYPQNVLAAVLSAHTDRFLIAHNHPSGPVTPTEDDLRLTASLMAAANAAGLRFEDHIITGPEGWFSFYDEGLLQRAEGVGLKAAVKATRRRARGGSR